MAEVSGLMSSHGQRDKNEVIQNGHQPEDDHRLVQKEKNVVKDTEDKLLKGRNPTLIYSHNTEGMCKIHNDIF